MFGSENSRACTEIRENMDAIVREAMAADIVPFFD